MTAAARRFLWNQRGPTAPGTGWTPEGETEWALPAGLLQVQSPSMRTEHPGREMWCAWTFPQLRGSEAGAITASNRACQCLAAPSVLPAG